MRHHEAMCPDAVLANTTAATTRAPEFRRHLIYINSLSTEMDAKEKTVAARRRDQHANGAERHRPPKAARRGGARRRANGCASRQSPLPSVSSPGDLPPHGSSDAISPRRFSAGVPAPHDCAQACLIVSNCVEILPLLGLARCECGRQALLSSPVKANQAQSRQEFLLCDPASAAVDTPAPGAALRRKFRSIKVIPGKSRQLKPGKISSTWFRPPWAKAPFPLRVCVSAPLRFNPHISRSDEE